MQLNQTTLRGILARIFSVNEKYVVPKQGNWWNPQENANNIQNWIAYRIKENRPRTTPFYKELDEGINSVVVLKIATIELQIVGPQSEEIAQSVAMWPLRTDVQNLLAECHGSIMYEDLTAVSSNFYQDGSNNIVAWNISNLKIKWYDVLQTNQQTIKTIDVGGQMNVGV